MDFNELIADFATRHNVSNLVADDNAAAHAEAENPSFGLPAFMQV